MYFLNTVLFLCFFELLYEFAEGFGYVFSFLCEFYFFFPAFFAGFYQAVFFEFLYYSDCVAVCAVDVFGDLWGIVVFAGVVELD